MVVAPAAEPRGALGGRSYPMEHGASVGPAQTFGGQWTAEDLLATLPSLLIAVDARQCVVLWNRYAEATLGLAAEAVLGCRLEESPLPWDWARIEGPLDECLRTGESRSVEDLKYTKPTGHQGILGLDLHPIRVGGAVSGCLLFGADITERKALQAQLAHAQKLEAIGLLAAGIAHEINTPTQFVGDNTQFLKDAFDDVMPLLEACAAMLRCAKEGAIPPDLLADVEERFRCADVPYLVREIPKAIEQSLAGLERVAKIVRAMKEFSHPGSEDMTYVDLNRALDSTITISRNEWKYVAEVETDFDQDLPPVPCLPGDLNQVFLNVIVNAAHAVADVVGDGREQKGLIRVSTRRDGNCVEVRIADTGTGIPESIQRRIFDPFFTTKGVGKGTGQGLALAHRIVTDRHRGSISVDSAPGQGATFIIRLPLEQPSMQRDERCA